MNFQTVVAVPVLDLFGEPKLGAERVSQEVLGNEITVLGYQDDWAQVALPLQGGYQGWCRKGQWTNLSHAGAMAFIIAPQVELDYNIPGREGVTLYLGTMTPAVQRGDGWVEVFFPSLGRGRLPADAVVLVGPKTLPPSQSKEKILALAKEYLGTPYYWGGMTKAGIDCSGFVHMVLRANGILVPRDADVQFERGQEVGREELQPGDLVFFSTYAPGPSHVGIFLGQGEFIHASSSTNGVAVSTLQEEKWSQAYLGSRRY